MQSVFLCFAYTKCFDDAFFREQNTKSLFVVYYPLVHPWNTFDLKNKCFMYVEHFPVGCTGVGRGGGRVLKLQNDWQMINKYVCLSWYQLI